LRAEWESVLELKWVMKKIVRIWMNFHWLCIFHEPNCWEVAPSEKSDKLSKQKG
jgi:hypothetical protein